MIAVFAADATKPEDLELVIKEILACVRQRRYPGEWPGGKQRNSVL